MDSKMNQKLSNTIEKYNKLLKHVYYSPNGFISAKPLTQTVLEKYKIKIPVSYTTNWIKKQGIAQITTIKKPKVLLHYRQTVPNQLHEADLLMVDKSPKGYRYILGVIDVASRFLIVRALKNKKDETIKKALYSIYSTHELPDVFETDAGSEFTSTMVKKYFSNNGVKLRTLNPRAHAAIIERVFQTIQRPLYKMRDVSYNSDWTKILQQIVDAYNNRVHGTIHLKPKKAIKMKSIKREFPELPESEIHKPVFHLGDMVRVRIPSERSVDFTFSDDKYRITAIFWFEVEKGVPNRYCLDYDQTHVYTEYDLIPANIVENPIDVKRWYQTFQ